MNKTVTSRIINPIFSLFVFAAMIIQFSCSDNKVEAKLVYYAMPG